MAFPRLTQCTLTGHLLPSVFWAAAVFLLIKREPKYVLILLLVYKEANTPAENDDMTSLRIDSPLPVRVSTQAKYFKFLKWLLLRQYKSRSMCHAYQQVYLYRPV